MKVKILSLIIFLFFSSRVFAQFLLPPYKAELSNMPGHIEQYWNEADLDGDGINEQINLSNFKNGISTIVFYKKENLLDAFNAPSIEDEFNYDYVYHSPIFKKDYYFFFISSKGKASLKMLSLKGKNSDLDIKTIYRFTFDKNTLFDAKYLSLPEKNLLIVTFLTLYPKHHSFRKLIAIDTKNFETKWILTLPDYINQTFYSSSNPDYFYFSTIAYSNGLFRSNKTFYRISKGKLIIDTTFIINPTLMPDTNAPDYAADTCSYIVKVNIENGQEVKRIKTGGAFFQTWFGKQKYDSTGYFVLFDRVNSSSSLFKYNFPNDRYDKIEKFQNYLSTMKVSSLGIRITDDYMIKYSPTHTEIFKLLPDKIILINTIKPQLLYVKPIPNSKYYWAPIDGEQIIFLDSTFNRISTSIKTPTVVGYIKITKSRIYDKIILTTKPYSHAKVINLTKLNFIERISPEFSKFILYFSISTSAILLLLWLLTMYISTKEVRKKNAELEKKNQELEKANRELEITTAKLIHSEKLAILGTISASIAHQLNSPLGAILNSSQRILRKNYDENASLIKRSAEYAKQLVQKFLETSRPDDKDEIACTKFTETVNDWFLLFGREIQNRGIELAKENEIADRKIPIRKSELLEIITNLIFNSRDAILASGKKERKIIFRSFIKDKTFYIEVEDTGKGFDEEILPDVLKPFKTTKKSGKGTGLGLWIVNKIIENKGGTIKLKNIANGAKVMVSIPFTEECSGE